MRPRRLFILATMSVLVTGCYQVMSDARRTFTWDLVSKRTEQGAHADFKASMELWNRWKVFFRVNRINESEVDVKPVKAKRPESRSRRLPPKRKVVAKRGS